MNSNTLIVFDPDQQFADIIALIQQTRNRVLQVANTALIDLYWNVGAHISSKTANAEWGDGIVQQLAAYIATNYPDIKGFSDKNLWRMKQFYETYQGLDEKLSTLLREISWSNNMVILSRTKSDEERAFYLQLCAKERLSYRELNRQIDSALFERSMVEQPKLSPVLREIVPTAQQVFRDQYVMEFIGGKTFKTENSMKSALIHQMKEFILELGKDFIFIDQEYHLQVGCSDFRIDLLFFQIKMPEFHKNSPLRINACATSRLGFSVKHLTGERASALLRWIYP